MKNRLIAGFTLLSFMGLSFPALALQPDIVPAQVEASSGQVLERNSDATWSALSSSDLTPGQVIRTGQDGHVILGFPNGDRVRLAADSELKVMTSDDVSARVFLHRGKLLGHASSALSVETNKSQASASAGQFVIQTSATGAGLEVLDGNAKLVALNDAGNTYPRLGSLPAGIDASKIALGQTSAQQTVGDYDFVAQKFKTKGGGERVIDSRESVGSDSDTLPDDDIPQPGPQTQVEPEQTPPPETATTPVEPTPPAEPAPATAHSSFPWGPVLGGAAGIALLVLLLKNDKDHDSHGGYIPVPSPSLP